MSELDYKIRLRGAAGEVYASAPVYPFVERRRAFPLKPTRRDWVRHAIFFLLTVVTATFAGMLHAAFDLPESTAAAPDNLAHATHWFGYIRLIPASVAQFVSDFVSDALAHPQLFTQGLTFALALLAILLAHEAGHYIACRRYRVNATLPYFIPAPPVFLAGTFGAFIKIKSPIPSRRALFDIGAAGPLAGFVLIVPVAILAALTASPAPPIEATAANAGTIIIFHDPLLMQIIWRIFRVNMDTIGFNPFYYAAWTGLLVTSLNLMPVGQLDGGHVVYSLLGARAHKWIGRAAFAMIATLSICGFLLHNSPSGFLYTVLLLVMLFVKHPYTQDETEELDARRIIIALVTLLVFILAFLPFPITIV
jgi:membrane-associated protease RseP (regulator of RpoE activity)